MSEGDNMKQQPDINKKYKINPGTIDRIAAFRQFVGEEAFNQILQGSAVVNIPFEEESYCKLLNIVLDEAPETGLDKITYPDAEAIISFFCQPFAGRTLKQAKSTLDGISSLLANLNPELIKTAMESMPSRKANDGTTNASSLQTETLNLENESLEAARS